jgi:pimeloyl-ACP methyl ester carboxylesterase
VEQYYDVVRFRAMDSGGHYGVFEQAEEYARELREFFRPLR